MLSKEDKADLVPGARTGWFLALAGALPIWVIAIAVLFAPVEVGFFFGGMNALVAYGAIILSFLGGVRWGAALFGNPLARARMLTVSVVPALVGWLAALLSAPWSLIVLAVAFVGLGWWDVTSSRFEVLPRWFGTLRLALTLIVVPALVLAAFA